MRPPVEQGMIEVLRELSVAECLEDVRHSGVALRRMLSADCMMFTFDQAGLLGRSPDGSGKFRYPGALYPADPLHARKAKMTARPRVLKITEIVARDEFEKNVTYHELYAPMGIQHALCAWFNARPYGTPGMAGVFLTRPRSRPPFTDEEARCLAALLPGFTAVARRQERARERDALSRFVDVRAAHPAILADVGGQALWMSAAAGALLRRQIGVDGVLPGRLRAAVRSLADTRAAVMPVVVLRLGAITCELQLLQRATPIVLIEMFPDEAEPITAAESRVLRWMEQGLTNRDIAIVLGLSIETVRSHSKSIYRKRGVASRLELLAQRRLS